MGGYVDGHFEDICLIVYREFRDKREIGGEVVEEEVKLSRTGRGEGSIYRPTCRCSMFLAAAFLLGSNSFWLLSLFPFCFLFVFSGTLYLLPVQ